MSSPVIQQSTTGELSSGFSGSRAENTRGFSIEQARHELKLAAHRLTAEEKRRQLDEIEKDNASRRRRENVGSYTILGVVVGGLLSSGAVGVASSNGATRDWAQGAFVLILGSLLGALAGYFTGKSSRT
jgi:hypothetical protein